MEYSARQIEVLGDLEAVRKRPGMYIGGVGVRGLHHLLWEVIDNSVDEALAGYCDNVVVTLHPDGSASVDDNGRGIPTGMHELGKSALEIVMTKLHAGGKFKKKAYRIAGGLHGVGLSVVNALSEWLEVWVFRNSKIYHQRYEKGVPVSEVKILGNTTRTGTKIRFKPDETIFESIRFDFDIISQRLRELSYLNKEIRFSLIDERDKLEEEFYTDKGIAEYVSLVNKNRETLHELILISSERNGAIIDVAVQFTATEFENVFAFANNIHTIEGGTHVAGFRAGLTRAINEYGKKNIRKFTPLSGTDIREGLTAVLSVKVPEPQFEGQTKTKLTNSETKTVVESVIYSGILEWLEEHPSEASRIIEKCLLSRKAREAARRAREIVKKRGEISITLPGKLADCSSKNPEERELFIVEGESAGGSAKQARNREFQAILSIRGKIINVEKAGFGKALKNEEVRAIASAIGAGIGSDFDSENVRYRRIIIMTDADVDGAHIKTLLLTFFYRYMRPLIEQGYLYIAQVPLYRVKKDKKTLYFYSEKELEDFMKKTDKAEVQRFKGLGEMNPEQLWETTMDPTKRILLQVTIEDALEAERLFSVLMGEDVESRRNFIIRHSKEAVLDI
ncbi:MAG TPA: DNA topoisomerase (ATP-hydrolyzing) subunit B [Archaeoglobaceae archaeon]|nr:DNA topoisomerase (ATP-hydrolyzing) subunit B [Archaeoglobaceae archaeon]